MGSRWTFFYCVNFHFQTFSYANISFDVDTSVQLARREKEIYYYASEMRRLKGELEGVILRNEDRDIHSKINGAVGAEKLIQLVASACI